MEQQNRIFTKEFISLFFTNMSVFIVYYGLIATLPLYVMGVLGRTDKDSGLLVTFFLFSAILVRPFCEKLLDLFGKKKLLMISLIVYLLCTLLYIFLKPFVLLLALRFFQGIWFSIATTAANSIAADIVPKNRKGTGLGYFAISINLAIVYGPFIGLLIVQYADFNLLFIILAVTLSIGAGYSTLVTSFQTLCIQSTIPQRSGYATATFFTFFDIGIALGSVIFGFIAVHWGYHSVYMLSATLLAITLCVYFIVFSRKAVTKMN